MHFLLQGLRVIWKLYFFAVFLVLFVLVYPVLWVLLAKKSRFPKAFQFMLGWSKVVRFFIGVPVHVVYKGDLPKPPYIITSNHSSYLDIPLMYGVFSDYFVFLSKVEVASWPLFNIFFKRNMHITVDRGNRKASAQSLDRAREELHKGHSLMIFPEATIPNDAPKLKRFKNGAFKLAIEENVPIVPVTFLNNWKRLQVGAFFKVKGGPGVSRVIVHEPVSPAGKDVPELRQEVYDTIAEALGQTE